MPDYHGFESGVLQNSGLRLEYLTQAGPRIVRIFLGGSRKNILGEFPQVEWRVGGDTYQLLGGHRLWAAPEQPGVSYGQDAVGLEIRAKDDAVDLVWKTEGEGIAKTIQLRLIEGRPAVELVHLITNTFEQTRQLAPWGITMLPLGGKAFLPSLGSGSGLLPDRHLVIWPYSNWDDSRIRLLPSGIQIEGCPSLPPLKIGTFSSQGTCAYLREGTLMVKRMKLLDGPYPDDHSNVEVYCADRYLELETLGTLKDLAPGESATLTETWEFYSGSEAEEELEAIFPGAG